GGRAVPARRPRPRARRRGAPPGPGRPAAVGAGRAGQRGQRPGGPRRRVPAGRHGGAGGRRIVSAVLLAALSAALWGTGDFCGGKASQRADSLHVAVVVALVGVPLIALAAAVLAPGAPTRADLVWGGVGGLAGFAGLVVFYRALSSGAMAVAAPVTAVASAVTPLAIGLAFERPPGVVALVGAGLAVVAVALVSVAPGRAGRVSTRVV